MEDSLSIELATKLAISNDTTPTLPDDKPKKVKKTLFWGVSLKTEPVHSHKLVAECLASNPQLVPLKSIHSTLLYVGRKDNTNEPVYEAHVLKKCQVVISGHGFSANALALKVDSITFMDDGVIVPSFAELQHVTLALYADTKAVDSVKTLQGEGSIVTYDEPFVLEGTLRRYF